MRWFARLSITRKLIAITMLTTSMVIMLMAAVITLNEIVRQKRSQYQKRTEQLATVAEIIGSRSTAALIFEDHATAQENLNALKALRANASIAYAAIYQPDNKLFAEYQTGSHDLTLYQQALSLGCAETPSQAFTLLLPVCTAVVLDGDRLGDVRIVFDMSNDLEQLQSSLIFYLGFLLLLVLVVFTLAWLLSAWLQRLVSRPILALRSAMGQVSENKDYSVRVERTSSDELGALVAGFNEMLTQIQSRDVELAHYSNQLEQQVQTRTAELAEANRRRLLWLENLAYFLRHELKNSTVGVRSSLDLIARRAANDGIEKYIDRARASITYMTKLLESVGAASTLEASFDKDEKTRLDLGELVSQQMEVYRSTYPNRSLVADCDVNTVIEGNSLRLVQLLDKLVGNAVDYGKRQAPIVVTVKKMDGQARLSVANEGEALPEDREHIFELFVSMRDAEYKDNENLGLGLYVVKLIAESHDGSVRAEDLPEGHGALFTVTLPLLQNRRS